jgi:predicted PurR-regulated permease PerM
MGGGARRHHAGPDGVAALLGALQGIVGALVAIPAAAVLLLLTQEVLIARLDHT